MLTYFWLNTLKNINADKFVTSHSYSSIDIIFYATIDCTIVITVDKNYMNALKVLTLAICMKDGRFFHASTTHKLIAINHRY